MTSTRKQKQTPTSEGNENTSTTLPNVVLHVKRHKQASMLRQSCCSSPLQTRVHSQSCRTPPLCIATTSRVYMRWRRLTQWGGTGGSERAGDEKDGKSHCTRAQSCLMDGTARSHLKHGKERHMPAKCALIQTHAAPLSDPSWRSGFTANTFQLPALSTPTVQHLPGTED